jgi:hypothetical protein
MCPELHIILTQFLQDIPSFSGPCRAMIRSLFRVDFWAQISVFGGIGF